MSDSAEQRVAAAVANTASAAEAAATIRGLPLRDASTRL